MKIEEKKFFSSIFINFDVLFTLVIYKKERWLSGRKRRIANPMYESIVPRVRISSSPIFMLIITYIIDKKIIWLYFQR